MAIQTIGGPTHQAAIKNGLHEVKFVSMASNEFKTPLNGILTSAWIIEKYNQKHPNEKIESHSRTIKNLVNQMNAILDDFLHLENVESDDYPVQLSRFDFFEKVASLVWISLGRGRSVSGGYKRPSVKTRGRA